MKKTFFICFLIFLCGCGLIPKKVEFFQKKVKAVPEQTEKAKENERQAAKYIDTKVEEALVQAVREDSSTNVINPLSDAHVVAPALSTSLGPPKQEFTGEAKELAVKLDKAVADLNAKLDKYRKTIEPLEGKKVEGTGAVQIPYFLYLGLVVGGLFVLYFVIKTAISIYGNINPAVGIGANAVSRITGKVAGKAFSEVVEAGEHFKEKVEKEFEDVHLQEKILNLFRSAHLEKQSRDVQDLIKDITK